jgi:hypothetical protein
MFAPAEESWRIPDADAGGARAWFGEAREAVLDGARHFVGNGVHVALAVALVLLGGLAVSVRLATAFAVGQLVAVTVFPVTGLRLGAALAEIGVAAAVVLLAREALRPAGERRRMLAVVAGAGFVHGLGLAQLVSPAADQGEASIIYYVLVVLGMDSVLLLVSLAGAGLRLLVPRRASRRPLATVVAYAVGVGAVGIALGLPAADSAAAREAPAGLRLPDLPIPEGATATPGSKRIAAPFPDAALQSFITIAPFEVRHEVLVRLRHVADRFHLDLKGDLPVEAQEEIKQRVRDLVAEQTKLTIDGRGIEPADSRIDFLSIDSRGALPRAAPVPEPVQDAWLGVTTVYLTDSTPDEVSLTWSGFDTRYSMPSTITDPESSRSVELTGRQPALVWKNELYEDPTPIVTAIAVEPPLLWIPVVSVLALGAGVAFGVRALRSRRRDASLALARVALAATFVFAPVGNVALPLPQFAAGTPDRAASKRILARLLPNVYRAFEFPTESAAYDRLARSVTGDTLTEIYLEHRRAVRMEERGGAIARIEAVEVVAVDSVERDDPGGFVAETVWTVGGTVTHFGHRHFRQNRYDARVAVVPVDGHWKIRTIEVLDEERLR